MANDLMDKNKSASKLKNIGPIYYINLDGQPERKEYMEAVSYTHLTLPTILRV